MSRRRRDIFVLCFVFTSIENALNDKQNNIKNGKTKKEKYKMYFSLVGEDGFEPSKPIGNRFTVCPLWPLGNSPIMKFISGAGGRIRTPDLLITNQLLYRLSYTSNLMLSKYSIAINFCQGFFISLCGIVDNHLL